MRYFIEIAYNGMAFHGWQIQPNSTSVQQTLNQALSTVLRREAYTVAAGRTDTGVHALQMFAHFDSSVPLEDTEPIVRSMNGILYPNISVKRIFRVCDSAHARFSAYLREYQYDIHYRHNPFLYHRSLLWLRTPLPVEEMNALCGTLIGEKDFSCFEKAGGSNAHSICHVSHAQWIETDEGVRFVIRANRFLRNMVRAIVGTFLEFGSRRISASDFKALLESKDRKLAGASAPPYALYLTKVCYPDSIFSYD
ncbi:MAG: tRNA pseudouridine(38-40) synthase TruA [Thermaurantimonas sp.]